MLIEQTSKSTKVVEVKPSKINGIASLKYVDNLVIIIIFSIQIKMLLLVVICWENWLASIKNVPAAVDPTIYTQMYIIQLITIFEYGPSPPFSIKLTLKVTVILPLHHKMSSKKMRKWKWFLLILRRKWQKRSWNVTLNV